MCRTDSTKTTHLTIFAVIIFIVWAFICNAAPVPQQKSRYNHASTTASGINPNLIMGNPSNATSNRSNKNNYLIVNPYFTLSYNSSKGTPNWVSWQLKASNIGSAPRVPFYPDTHLPSGFQTIVPNDYTGSGFDRGHMCPHQDRSANSKMSTSTFVMTNIIPQSPPLNQKTWMYLEDYCRDLAQQGNVLYIISGPYGIGGRGNNGLRKTIGIKNTVTVPLKCWKVIMVLPANSGGSPKNATKSTRLIAVMMPNIKSLSGNWARYRTSVATVEQMTGYKFFNKVPQSIIGPLKKKVDTMPIKQYKSGH